MSCKLFAYFFVHSLINQIRPTKHRPTNSSPPEEQNQFNILENLPTLTRIRSESLVHRLAFAQAWSFDYFMRLHLARELDPLKNL